ncbi:MAG TPA: hypothetical protein VGO11_21550 [Chthoniobacteraceae bacterium]|jgi:hypothetical protein|nr:hypothetical protein [Chthoniobacteraceae bacterium]
MIELDKATADDFSPALDQDFELITGTGTISLRLVAVDKKGLSHPARPEPFTLRFEGAPPLRIPQAIYRLQNVTVGTIDLFLVQLGADAKGSQFEAVFN